MYASYRREITARVDGSRHRICHLDTIRIFLKGFLFFTMYNVQKCIWKVSIRLFPHLLALKEKRYWSISDFIIFKFARNTILCFHVFIAKNFFEDSQVTGEIKVERFHRWFNLFRYIAKEHELSHSMVVQFYGSARRVKSQFAIYRIIYKRKSLRHNRPDFWAE